MKRAQKHPFKVPVGGKNCARSHRRKVAKERGRDIARRLAALEVPNGE